MDDYNGIKPGRLHVGLATLWKQSLGPLYMVKPPDHPKLLLQICLGNKLI